MWAFASFEARQVVFTGSWCTERDGRAVDSQVLLAWVLLDITSKDCVDPEDQSRLLSPSQEMVRFVVCDTCSCHLSSRFFRGFLLLMAQATDSDYLRKGTLQISITCDELTAMSCSMSVSQGFCGSSPAPQSALQGSVQRVLSTPRHTSISLLTGAARFADSIQRLPPPIFWGMDASSQHCEFHLFPFWPKLISAADVLTAVETNFAVLTRPAPTPDAFWGFSFSAARRRPPLPLPSHSSRSLSLPHATFLP